MAGLELTEDAADTHTHMRNMVKHFEKQVIATAHRCTDNIACQASDLSKHTTVKLKGFTAAVGDLQAKFAPLEGQVADVTRQLEEAHTVDAASGEPSENSASRDVASLGTWPRRRLPMPTMAEVMKRRSSTDLGVV